MKIKKNTLVYKIRVWAILYLGVIQTLNYIVLGVKMRGERGGIANNLCAREDYRVGLFVRLAPQ